MTAVVVHARSDDGTDRTRASEVASSESVAIDCPELERCLECGMPGCPFGELVAHIVENGDPITYLDALPKAAKSEAAKRSRVCLEQGYCGLYCASSCAIGKCLHRIAEEMG